MRHTMRRAPTNQTTTSTCDPRVIRAQQLDPRAAHCEDIRFFLGGDLTLLAFAFYRRTPCVVHSKTHTDRRTVRAPRFAMSYSHTPSTYPDTTACAHVSTSLANTDAYMAHASLAIVIGRLHLVGVVVVKVHGEPLLDRIFVRLVERGFALERIQIDRGELVATLAKDPSMAVN